jgi:hypothetical protein
MSVWSTIKGWFEPAPARYIDVNVGRTVATITTEDATYQRTFDGDYWWSCPGYDEVDDDDGHLVHSGYTNFTTWLESSGKTGACAVGGGIYIPMCNIKSIQTKNTDHVINCRYKRRPY